MLQRRCLAPNLQRFKDLWFSKTLEHLSKIHGGIWYLYDSCSFMLLYISLFDQCSEEKAGDRFCRLLRSVSKKYISQDGQFASWKLLLQISAPFCRAWFLTGQRLRCYLQKGSQTIMPVNIINHKSWNLSYFSGTSSHNMIQAWNSKLEKTLPHAFKQQPVTIWAVNEIWNRLPWWERWPAWHRSWLPSIPENPDGKRKLWCYLNVFIGTSLLESRDPVLMRGPNNEEPTEQNLDAKLNVGYKSMRKTFGLSVMFSSHSGSSGCETRQPMRATNSCQVKRPG